MRRKRYTSAEVSRGRMAGGSPLHVPDVTSSPPRRPHLPTSPSPLYFLVPAAACNFPRPSEFYDPGVTRVIPSSFFFFFLIFPLLLPSSLFDFSYFPLGFVYLVSDINDLVFWTGLKLRIKLEECE